MTRMLNRSVWLAIALLCGGSGAAMLLWPESPPDSRTVQAYIGILILPITHRVSLYLIIGALWVRSRRKGRRIRLSEYVLTLAILVIWTAMVAGIVRSDLMKRISRRGDVGIDARIQPGLAAQHGSRQKAEVEGRKMRVLRHVNECFAEAFTGFV